MKVYIYRDELYPVYFMDKSTDFDKNGEIEIPDDFYLEYKEYEYATDYYQELLSCLQRGFPLEKSRITAKEYVEKQKEFDKEFEDE